MYVVPLLTLGADQTQDACALYAPASSSVECFHLDGLGLKDQKRLQKYLTGFESRAGQNFLLVCSPLLLLSSRSALASGHHQQLGVWMKYRKHSLWGVGFRFRSRRKEYCYDYKYFLLINTPAANRFYQLELMVSAATVAS